VLRQLETEDISSLACLNQRSPLLAATMTISMVSLAGIPPLAGFFGKFLLLKAAVEAAQTTGNHGYYCLVFTALAGVVISLYYYFGVIKVMYWSRDARDLSPIPLSATAMITAWVCIAGIFWLGVFPNTVINLADAAVKISGN
jgi:NADH-quinone oxidoreductase subunit N